MFKKIKGGTGDEVRVIPRTELDAIDPIGPELDEGQLLSVTGGNRKDGGSDPTTSCPSGCHD